MEKRPIKAFKMRTKESCEVSREAQGDSGEYTGTGGNTVTRGRCTGDTGREITRKGKERAACAKDPEKRMQHPWGGANVRAEKSLLEELRESP